MTEYSRRRYRVEDPALDKARRIELVVLMDGRPIVHVQAREPGLLAFVSREGEQGFDVDIVEPVGRRYVDRMLPSEVEQVAEWQRRALEGAK